MKKTLIAISVIIALLAGGAYFWHWQQGAKIVSDPVDAIPTSAVIIISYPNIIDAWDTFEDQDYFDAVTGIEELDLFFGRNQLLDSLIRYDQQLKKTLSDSKVWSSFHSGENDTLMSFHAIQVNGSNDQKTASALSQALANNGTITKQAFGEIFIYQLAIEEPENELFFTVVNGLVLTSSSEQLLQESISQLKLGKSLKTNKQFTEAISASGKNVEANLLINYANLPEYLSGVLKPNIGSSIDDEIRNIAGWTELDVNMKSEGLTFNGFSYTSDSLNQFLNLFLKQEPQPINFPEFLPATTASFLFFGMDDVLNLSTSYRDFLDATARLSQMEAKLDSLNAYYEIDLESNVLAWLGNSFGLCITEPKTASFTENTYFVLEARSADLAKKLLLDLSQNLTSKNGLTTDSLSVNGNVIRKLPLNGLLAELFGNSYEAFENPYYTVYKSYVIFGQSQESLASYLQFLHGDRTLAKELSFSRFAENLGSTYNVFSYNQLTHSQPIFESYLSENAVSVVEKNKNIADNFEALGAQISSTGKSFYSNVFLKYNPAWKSTEESSWEAKMDAKPIRKPVYVKNHLNQQREILVQDAENALYLFNEVGQRLFKAELPEKIMGTVQQVDALKNGKLQYIFNTKNFIYLVDRKGRSVSGFPIELSSPAVTELAVLDYDKSRNYRLLIACANKRIYNYNIKGKKIQGWKHNKAKDPTIHPFKHIASNGKDYIITGESNGKIHLLDRRGKNRLKVKKRVKPSKNNHLQTFKSSEKAFTGIYITDESGTIHRVSLSGDVNPMDLGKFSPDHIFMIADLDKDGGPEFIFSDLNVLQVYNYKKQKIAELRLEPSASRPFLVDLGDDGLGIGYCYKESEQLVLFNANGSIVSGFPLSGSSPFSVAKTESGLNVISAGAENGLIIQAID
ncbi:MAG: DUF3352 domain-containing protein [Flavobacteriales bacterium]